MTLTNIPANIHAIQWYETQGEIEFTDGTPNQPITVLPDWAINAESVWQVAYDASIAPPPAPLPPTADQNKALAASKLYQTDWTTISDVSDPSKSNPYLMNVADFTAYRNQIRQIAINPVAGNIDWVVEPTPKWSN